ncbi:MAG: hypothetical protein GKR94_25800 [Gammaproteobacteria bacterium]|nr:hypothetical protein [Gammaproteobacteria bacterium]
MSVNPPKSEDTSVWVKGSLATRSTLGKAGGVNSIEQQSGGGWSNKMFELTRFNER